jgi:hypothetical protein
VIDASRARTASEDRATVTNYNGNKLQPRRKRPQSIRLSE